MVLFYCYDAYCGWCYGFSPVIKRLSEQFAGQLSFEVLSGGMVLPDHPVSIAATASYIQQAYKQVEAYTGIRFGQDYLWHIQNPDKSDWYPSSEKPAIALCVFKDDHPDQQVSFASDLQYALYYEGRDLTDDEAYRHLLEKYSINAEEFYQKLHSQTYKDKAYEEFNIVKRLHVTGFPTVLLQENASRFHLLARGYTDYDTLVQRLEQAIQQIGNLNA